MKKLNIFCSVLIPILTVFGVLACEKAIIGEGKEVTTDDPDGNVHVTVYQVAKTPFSDLTRAGSDPAIVMTRLNFAVYTLEGTRVKQVNKTSDNSAFNQCSFQLEPGDYQLVVVGHSSSGNPTMTDPTCIKFTNAQGFTETFMAYQVLTVTGESQEVGVNIDRIRFYYTGGSGAFDASTGLGCVNSKQDVWFDVASGQHQFDLYTFLHDNEGTIHLHVTAHDANDNIIQERTFDVPMEQNHITWLTGAFFSGSGSSSSTTITVTVNTDWAGETHLTF